MRRQSEKHTAGVVGSRPAVASEADGSWWADFEIGNRNGGRYLLRLYKRLPDAELYDTDGYRVYGWLPADHHEVDKGDAVNWNEGLHS